MSVNNNKVIDAISINPMGVVILTIADHLEWDVENEHLLILQDKINAYLEVLISGDIYEYYPAALGKNFQINLVCKYPPNIDAVNFLSKIKELLGDYGCDFTFHQM